MRLLSAAELLDLWERGRGRHPLDRALLVLGTAFPDVPYDRLAELPIGRRDAALLERRLATFGARLQGDIDCSACSERLAFTLDARALRLPAAGEGPVIAAGLSFRLPTSRDLAQAIDEPDPERVARRLAELCLLPAEGQAVRREWPEALLAEVESRMAEADPQADVELALACEACGHAWNAALDIGGLFWEELEARALRLLHDVHLLARAYGWSEQEVLALSEARRAAYIGMVGG
jgi:hypothetical protein